MLPSTGPPVHAERGAKDFFQHAEYPRFNPELGIGIEDSSLALGMTRAVAQNDT